ncbi:zinc-dependent metalloprotease [Corynebacterium sp. TAE3-ERU12]|uniref:zinc-dependent metalloprotease n=1 Tax=Corynebacterium sp. TAE3-ERU12 TaxID=2849491 RepID=UPI001C449353|nr:zinc-dependent metalloprotease [Corynebacterium sp. TAE3-ERU12]MBV7294850.1 zinc-dependent metalloprotease [Corynebacterium sp. TAE3-ERU12]
MTNRGFGFTPGDDDDEEGKNNPGGNNPFGFFGFPMGGFGGSGSGKNEPNLGELLNQFGQMLSGVGQSMGDGSAPVNHEVAERIARQKIGNQDPVRESDVTALTDALRLAEVWLDQATTLPAGANRAEGWNATQWLEHTMPTWKRIVDPVAKRMSDASTESMPEEARQVMGPMMGMLNRMNSMNFGVQLGGSLADIANSALTGSEFGLPLATSGAAVLLPRHLRDLAKELELPEREMLVYACAREAAHQRLYDRVPWLAERMISSVEEYAAGLELDYSQIEEASREISPEVLQDPARMQEAMERLQNMDFSPQIRSANEHARTRLETLLALVEGWVDVVVMDALGDRLPGANQLDEAWRRRRATEGAEQALKKSTGIDLGAPKVREAAELWRRLTTAAGMERRDQVWDHSDFLPVAEDLDSPAGFIDGVIGGQEGDDFDPIAELEEQMRREQNGETPKDNQQDDNGDS